MDIKLIPVEKGSKFTFPALPEKVQGKYAAKYQSFDIISLGTVKVPKGTDVSEFSWDGVFFGASKKNEAIVKTNAWKSPNECVKILNDYMLNETVLTLIVTETWINVDVTISSFQPRPVGAYGNVEYSITFIQKKPLKIYSTNELKIAAFKENEAESQFIIERRQLYSSLRRYAVGHRFKETGKRYQVDDNLRCKQGYDRVHGKETRKEQFRSRSLDMARRSSDNPRIGGAL